MVHTFYNLLTWLAAFVLAISALSIPIEFVRRVRLRSRFKRAFRKLGYEVKRIGWRFQYDGIPIVLESSDAVLRGYVRPFYGKHMHLFDSKGEMSHFVFCDANGDVNLHKLPSPILWSGKFPYLFSRDKYAPNVCTIGALLAFAVTLLLAWWPFDWVLVPWLRKLQIHTMGSSTLEKGREILIIATGMLCFLCIPFAVARRIYRHMKRELITSEYPICQKCGYDLRGNESGACPECGAKRIHEETQGDS